MPPTGAGFPGMGMPQGMGMGMPPLGMMGGQPPADPAMQALSQLNGMPAPQREEQAIAEASANIQIAMTAVSMRNPVASKHLASAYKELQQALESMRQTADMGVGAPPDLLGSTLPMGQGMPGPGV